MGLKRIKHMGPPSRRSIVACRQTPLEVATKYPHFRGPIREIACPCWPCLPSCASQHARHGGCAPQGRGSPGASHLRIDRNVREGRPGVASGRVLRSRVVRSALPSPHDDSSGPTRGKRLGQTAGADSGSGSPSLDVGVSKGHASCFAQAAVPGSQWLRSPGLGEPRQSVPLRPPHSASWDLLARKSPTRAASTGSAGGTALWRSAGLLASL